MTVKQFIEALQSCPPNYTVVIDNEELFTVDVEDGMKEVWINRED